MAFQGFGVQDHFRSRIPAAALHYDKQDKVYWLAYNLHRSYNLPFCDCCPSHVGRPCGLVPMLGDTCLPACLRTGQSVCVRCFARCLRHSTDGGMLGLRCVGLGSMRPGYLRRATPRRGMCRSASSRSVGSRCPRRSARLCLHAKHCPRYGRDSAREHCKA